MRARVLPEFGDETLKQITAPAVRGWLAAMSEEGLAPSTVYNYRRALAQILDHCDRRTSPGGSPAAKVQGIVGRICAFLLGVW